jgi:hypothetical protein
VIARWEGELGSAGSQELSGALLNTSAESSR